MSKQLVRPELSVVSVVIEKAIAPALRDIEQDVGQSLPTVVTLWTPAMEGPKILVTGEGTLNAALESTAKGEMRLSFRETAVTGRLLFFGETLYGEDVSPATGFSGFDIRGAVRVQGKSISVEDDSWTIKYNVSRFRGWR